MADADTIKSPALLEAERKARAEHAVVVSKATLEIEEVLLKNNLTWSDWGDIIETMNARSQSVFGNTLIKDIKKSYG